MSAPHLEDKDPIPPPDAFFPGVPRFKVVLLGILLIIVGTLAFVFLPQLWASQSGDSSQRIPGFLWGLCIISMVTGFVFLFKKPQAGSPPGSPEYDRLVAKQQADIYRTFMGRTMLGAVLGLVLAVICIPLGLNALNEEPSRAPVFLVIGGLSLLGSIAMALVAHAARRGRLKHVKLPKRHL